MSVSTPASEGEDIHATLKGYFNSLAILWVPIGWFLFRRAHVLGLVDPQIDREDRPFMIGAFLASNLLFLLLLWIFTVRGKGTKCVAVLTVLTSLGLLLGLAAMAMEFDAVNLWDWALLSSQAVSVFLLGLMWSACSRHRARLVSAPA